MKLGQCLGLILIVSGLSATARAQEWRQFRGPNGDGVVKEAKLPGQWGEDQEIAWKTPIPGRGWSQPVVAGDKIFVTTAVADDEEKPRRGEFRGIVPDAADTRALVYRCQVLCLDASTGKVLWEQTAHEGKPKTRKHRSNTYASETPATDGERLIAYFGMTGIYCYDLSGKPLWSKNLDLPHAGRLGDRQLSRAVRRCRVRAVRQ
jgi:outer membrane protein assembly factor BamB